MAPAIGEEERPVGGNSDALCDEAGADCRPTVAGESSRAGSGHGADDARAVYFANAIHIGDVERPVGGHRDAGGAE